MQQEDSGQELEVYTGRVKRGFTPTVAWTHSRGWFGVYLGRAEWVNLPCSHPSAKVRKDTSKVCSYGNEPIFSVR